MIPESTLRRTRMRRLLLAAGVVLASVGATSAAGAAASPGQLGEVQLAALRDRIAAAAPVGSVTYLDPDTAAVVVRVPGPATTALLGTIGRHGAQVHVHTGAAPVTPQAMLYGGLPMDAGYVERRCSTGFIAVGNGWRWMLTAGHCTKGATGTGNIWFGAGGLTSGGLIGVGNIHASYFPGDDFGAIQISQVSPHQTGPYVLKHGTPLHITKVGMAGPGKAGLPGTAVCKTGRTTGTTCGTVTAKDVSVTYTQGVVHGLTETTACSGSGDSGGPFFSPDKVLYFDRDYNRSYHYVGYGIMSGANGFACSSGLHRSYYQPLPEVLTTYNLTLLI